MIRQESAIYRQNPPDADKFMKVKQKMRCRKNRRRKAAANAIAACPLNPGCCVDSDQTEGGFAHLSEYTNYGQKAGGTGGGVAFAGLKMNARPWKPAGFQQRLRRAFGVR